MNAYELLRIMKLKHPKERVVTPKIKTQQKKHKHHGIEELNAEFIMQEANNFLNSLEDLRREIIARDEMYKAAKKSGDKNEMEKYHQLASAISQKCLDYGRVLCDNPVPQWVEANMSKDNAVISKHAYEVIRNKICASLNVFESDLLPNAHTLLSFAEGHY